MKRLVGLGLQGGLVLAATLLLSRAWLRHPDLGPQLPMSFWIWLSEAYGARNGEELADLEIIVVLGLSLAVVMLALALLKRAWRRWQRARTASSWSP